MRGGVQIAAPADPRPRRSDSDDEEDEDGSPAFPPELQMIEIPGEAFKVPADLTKMATF